MREHTTDPSPRMTRRRFSTRPVLFGTSLVAGLTMGCDTLSRSNPELPEQPKLEDTAQPQSSSTSARPDSISDAEVKHAIVHRLFADGVFPTTSVDVMVKKGIVELSGDALSIFAKSQAEDIVRTTKGVRGYVDKMGVARVDISDADLKSRVDQSLLFDPATESYEIDTHVEEGVVELTGEVDSWAEFALASDVVASVMGVQDIENRLKVTPKKVRPNREIKAEILERLENDVLVDAAMIDVTVNDGVVKLDGIVGSAAEQSLAMNKSWVSGVNYVKNALKVEWWDRDRFVSEKSSTLLPDVEVKAAVNDALSFDARVNHHDIDIYVDDGRVTLTGTVPDLRSRNKASETAQNTLGVTRVRNYLRVEPKDHVDDERLQRRVMRTLRLNPYLTDWTGTVRTKDGIVYLEGTVTNQRQKRRAQAVVSRVMGVSHIENNLHVYLEEIADRNLASDVEEELDWNAFVDRDNIELSVGRGMVTLTGEVDSIRSFREAAAAARAAGAEVVFNRLKIAPATLSPKEEKKDS